MQTLPISQGYPPCMAVVCYGELFSSSHKRPSESCKSNHLIFAGQDKDHGTVAAVCYTRLPSSLHVSTEHCLQVRIDLKRYMHRNDIVIICTML